MAFWAFNNGFSGSSGLTFQHSRASATVDYAGTSIPVDTPLYDRPRLYLGAPNVSTVSGLTSTNTYQVLGTGFMADGTTPVAIIMNNSTGLVYFNIGSTVDIATAKTLSAANNGSKGSKPDFLQESYDYTGKTNEAFLPKSCVVVHGVVVFSCLVNYNDGGSWRANRVGLVQVSLKAIQDFPSDKTKWVVNSWMSDEGDGLDTVDNTFMSTSWALQSWYTKQRGNSNPTEFWISVVDYASTTKTGGRCYIQRFVRSGSSESDWLAGDPVEIISWSRTSTTSTHAHVAGLDFPDDGSIVVLVSRGDSSANNCIYRFTKTDREYTTGATPTANGRGWYELPLSPSTNGYPTVGWTTEIVNGWIDSPTSLTYDNLPAASIRVANQWIGMVPVARPNVAVGADETTTAVMKTSFNSSALEFTPLARMWLSSVVTGTSGTSSQNPVNSAGCLVFNMSCENPANAAASSSRIVVNYNANSPQEFKAIRDLVLYSPDGANFAPFFRSQQDAQAKIRFFNGDIFVSSMFQSSPYPGIKHIVSPNSAVVRPLLVAAGGKNYQVASPSWTNRGDFATNGTLTAPATLPSGYDTPPCSGRIELIEYIGSNADLGVWTLATAGSAIPAVSTGQCLLIKFWICKVKPSDMRSAVNGGVGSRDITVPTDGSNSCGETFKLRVRYGGTLGGYIGNTSVLENDGSWHPIVLKVHPSTMASSANATVEVFMELDLGRQAKFFIAWDQIVVNSENIQPVTALATGVADSAAVTGFNISDGTWTAYAFGGMPIRCDWDYFHPESYYNSTSNSWYSDAANSLIYVPHGINTAVNFYVGHRLFGSSDAGNYGLGIASTLVSGGSSAAITSISGSAGTATVVTSTAHGFTTGDKVHVYGSTQSGYHGLQTITVTDTTHFTYSNGTTAAATGGACSSHRFSISGLSYTGTFTGHINAPTGEKALCSFSNTAGDRYVVISADRTNGKIRARYWNGSSYSSAAELTDIFFNPESLFILSLERSGTNLTLRASIGGTEISSASVTVASIDTLNKWVAGEPGGTILPMSWFGGRFETSAYNSNYMYDPITGSYGASNFFTDLGLGMGIAID